MKISIFKILIRLFLLLLLTLNSCVKKTTIDKNNMKDVELGYRIEGAYSPYLYVQLDIYGDGKGQVVYKKYDDLEEKVLDIWVSSEELSNIIKLYEELDFFNLKVKDLNEKQIVVTDVGQTTLKLKVGNRQRVITYGYVKNPLLTRLVSLYWRIARKYLPF